MVVSSPNVISKFRLKMIWFTALCPFIETCQWWTYIIHNIQFLWDRKSRGSYFWEFWGRICSIPISYPWEQLEIIGLSIHSLICFHLHQHSPCISVPSSGLFPSLVIRTTFMLDEGPSSLLYDLVLMDYISNNPVSK